MNECARTIFPRPRLLGEAPTHYCPGCGHGIIHRLLAEVLEELDIAGRTVGIAPVGCSILIYNYVKTDFVEALHGRAPAFATGLKRVSPGLIVFTYQGDGDMASIGMGEIIHAANRGEKITAIFVNNAIYGMTGGQMAPTTMPGQITATSPRGRNVEEYGYPVRMAELLSALRTPSYIERVAVYNPRNIVCAKKAIRRAFRYQMENRCFSLVEVLSTCPTNWGMTPGESFRWLETTMLPYYPLGCFKTPESEEA